MVQQLLEGDLTGSLIEVVSNPTKASALHGILGGFCHQCRNTLNSLKLSLYLAKRDPTHASSTSWCELDRRYREVELLFDRVQTICRPMTLTPIRASLSLIMEERGPLWVEAMAACGRCLSMFPPKESDVGEFDPVQLPNALSAFIQWRAEVCDQGSPAELRWGMREDRLVIDWDESTTRGIGGSPEGSERSDPLALPLLARVVAAHGGNLTLDIQDGLHLGASWPLAVRPSQ